MKKSINSLRILFALLGLIILSSFVLAQAGDTNQIDYSKWRIGDSKAQDASTATTSSESSTNVPWYESIKNMFRDSTKDPNAPIDYNRWNVRSSSGDTGSGGWLIGNIFGTSAGWGLLIGNFFIAIPLGVIISFIVIFLLRLLIRSIKKFEDAYKSVKHPMGVRAMIYCLDALYIFLFVVSLLFGDLKFIVKIVSAILFWPLFLGSSVWERAFIFGAWLAVFVTLVRVPGLMIAIRDALRRSKFGEKAANVTIKGKETLKAMWQEFMRR